MKKYYIFLAICALSLSSCTKQCDFQPVCPQGQVVDPYTCQCVYSYTPQVNTNPNPNPAPNPNPGNQPMVWDPFNFLSNYDVHVTSVLTKSISGTNSIGRNNNYYTGTDIALRISEMRNAVASYNSVNNGANVRAGYKAFHFAGIMPVGDMSAQQWDNAKAICQCGPEGQAISTKGIVLYWNGQQVDTWYKNGSSDGPVIVGYLEVSGDSVKTIILKDPIAIPEPFQAQVRALVVGSE